MRGSGQSGGDCIAWQPIDSMGQCLCVCVTERTRVRERVDEWEVREKKGGNCCQWWRTGGTSSCAPD